MWKTHPLKLKSSWYEDGPLLPIEFARVGDGGELSTALCEGARLQKVWWAELAATNLDEAREQLRRREEIDPAHPEWIGSWPAPAQGTAAVEIGRWARTVQIDAVVWTALPPRVDGVEGRCPDAKHAVRYLQSLTGDRRAHAEDYICRVPGSMDTVNRRLIMEHLGWVVRS